MRVRNRELQGRGREAGIDNFKNGGRIRSQNRQLRGRGVEAGTDNFKTEDGLEAGIDNFEGEGLLRVGGRENLRGGDNLLLLDR